MISFIIPSENNEITEIDLEKGILRITVDFKEHFPEESGKIILSYNNLQKEVSYSHRPDRSHIVSIGKDVIEELRLQAGDKIRFTEVKHFLIEKA